MIVGGAARLLGVVARGRAPGLVLGPILGLVAILGLAGCASGGARSVGAPAQPSPADRADEEVLVVLPQRPVSYWAEVTRSLARLHNLERVVAWEMASLRELCVVYRVPSYTTAREMADLLSRDPRVRLAQPNQQFRVQSSDRAVSAGSDPYLDLQHAARSLRLREAHRKATGRGVTIAIVDTGVDVGHPDLRGRIAGAADFVNQGGETFTSDVHGTAVAGVLAASAGNDAGIVGVAPEARLLALKACWHEPAGSRSAVCSSYTLAKAVDSVLGSDARVLTLSLTGPDDPLVARLLSRVLETGVVVVAAVDPVSADGGFPAHLRGVLAPWPAPPEEMSPEPATGPVGPEDALRAPAVEILTTIPRAAYDFFSGTSFAAAHAAGVAALVLELRPDATPALVADLLERSARPFPDGDQPPSSSTAADALPSGDHPPADGPGTERRTLHLLDAAAALDALSRP